MVWEQRIGGVAATFTAFRNEIRDLIELAQILPPDSLEGFGPLAFQHHNVASVRAMGFEAEVQALLPWGILGMVGYGFTDSVDESTGRVVVNSPKHLFRARASWDWPGLAKVGVNLRAESSRRTLYGTETDPTSVVDLTASTEPLLDRVRFQAMVRNLFDKEYSLPSGFQHIQSSIPQPGRVLTLRADVGW
jgi:iron complex outermembrane receptor protein